MPAGKEYLQPQTPQMLFKYAYWLSAAARWMLAGSLKLNPACKVVFASLSAIPVGMVSNYQQCLLV